MKLKIGENVITASLNPKCTGSYKKTSVSAIQKDGDQKM